MTAAQRKSDASKDALDLSRRPRNDPQRLRAFADRFNVMLGEMGLPERGRAKVLQDRMGVGNSTAANWLRGEAYPSFEELGRIHNRLGLDPMRLLADGSATAKLSAEMPKASKVLQKLMDAGQMAALTRMPGGAGEPENLVFPASVWRHLLGEARDDVVLHVLRGDAGNGLEDGTPVLIDTAITQITEDHALYALLLGDSIIVRRVQRRLQGGYLITSDNSRVAPETVDQLGSHGVATARAGGLQIVGRVVVALQRL